MDFLTAFPYFGIILIILLNLLLVKSREIQEEDIDHVAEH